MSESIQERLQIAGAELKEANRHVSSIRQMGDGQESFLDLFESLQDTILELFRHSDDAYDHTAKAHAFGQKANQALGEAGLEAEADYDASETRQKFTHALGPAVESMENVGVFASERAGIYVEALTRTTEAMGILQLRAADCQIHILETQGLVNKYPSL